ncbi:MAG: DEAD/DEAH box helicase, partial [Deferrisomatales bacterium]
RLLARGESGPHLVVVPKTLLENWSREVAKFSGGTVGVHQYDGRRFSRESLAGCDIVLTTYDTLRRDQARLGTVDWNLVACDEAQYAKNPTAQRTSAVKALKARHRAALTGTPVENGLIEFWCIMDFVQPGLLGSWADFRRDYERPIVEGAADERDGYVQRLLEKIQGHYLRRLKTEVLKDLPAKHAHYREVALGDDQFDLYRRIAREGKAGGKGAALGAIQRLIILSAHPDAVSGASARNDTVDRCPKLAETIKILQEVRETGEKVIVFSDFKAIQRILRDAIRERFGLWPDIVNGDLTENRQAVIDIFSARPGFNVVILGHQVGGVGLNITAANHVIHYTRPWNPAKENQSTDRVHRIGQAKEVHVYYPIIKDGRFTTVEERLDDVIRSKEGLARDVLRPSSELKVDPEELINCLEVP